jgi:hypothetical protein
MARIDEDDLIKHWTLIGGELAEVAGKRGPTRLAFAPLLKFYTRRGRFPAAADRGAGGRRRLAGARPAADRARLAPAGLAGRAGAAKTGVPGQDDRLAPVGDLELAEDRGYVVGDGLRRDRHLPGDLGVAHACRYQVEHLAFPAGQGLERNARWWRR